VGRGEVGEVRVDDEESALRKWFQESRVGSSWHVEKIVAMMTAIKTVMTKVMVTMVVDQFQAILLTHLL
jgi:hypothetical protein